MAGYSGTPLPQKLGIKAGHQVALVNAPPGFTRTLGSLPSGVALHEGLPEEGPLDVIVLFAADQAQFRDQFPTAVVRLAPAGGLWVAWPKKASGVATDLSEAVVRTVGLEAGLVDNKVCAVDDTWAGLRFVVRLKDRPRRV